MISERMKRKRTQQNKDQWLVARGLTHPYLLSICLTLQSSSLYLSLPWCLYLFFSILYRWHLSPHLLSIPLEVWAFFPGQIPTTCSILSYCKIIASSSFYTQNPITTAVFAKSQRYNLSHFLILLGWHVTLNFGTTPADWRNHLTTSLRFMAFILTSSLFDRCINVVVGG